MKNLIAVSLGTIQGLTEYLPISSSAHLTAIPYLLGWDDPGLTFDVGLHLGTLLAVICFFFKDLLSLEKKLCLKIILATLPGALIGYLLNDYAESVFRSPLIIGLNLILFGGILFWADQRKRFKKKFSEITLCDALLIGISQALAIIPGVSRSGITISAALFLGIKRDDSAKFSFLLAIPIIAGAGVLKLPHLLESHLTLDFFLGFTAATFSGFLSIKFLINYLKEKSCRIFVYYRIIFGLGLLLL